MTYVFTIANAIRRQIIAAQAFYLWLDSCFFGVLCLVAVGCAQDVSDVRSIAPTMADTSLLTPEMGKTLTAKGLFNLVGQTPGAAGELTEAQARVIARAWARQFFPWVQGPLEKQRGLAIDGAKLQDCPRLFYAESPYVPVDDISDGGVARRVFGPWWIAPLCVNGVPQIALGIAAYATELEVPNDRAEFPKLGGGEFVWRGIPIGAVEFPLSPEAAARFAAIRTGSRVASVPQLIMPHFRDGGPGLARWEMAIAPAVTLQSLQGQDTSHAVNVFVGAVGPGHFDPILLRPSKYQPNEVQIGVASPTRKRADHTLVLVRKNGGILRLEAVEVRKP
jgi:hypothetical protein